MPTKATEVLNELASKINADYTTLQSGDKQRKSLVIAIAKNCCKAKRDYEKEKRTAVKEERDPEYSSWESWVGENLVISYGHTKKYVSIGRVIPEHGTKWLEPGMSINEAAKLANKIRSGKVDPQRPEWGGSGNYIFKVAKKIGKLSEFLEKELGKTQDLSDLAESEGWEDDDITGYRDTVKEVRKLINAFDRLVKEVYPD